jgi:hypothetical protein
MKFEQVFENYKIVVDLNNKLESISVVNMESEVCWLSVKSNKIDWCRKIPSDVKSAFELVNMYQEALAITNTKNLTVDLLVEIVYNEIK